MFIAVVQIVTKIWKPKFQTPVQWLNKLWYTHTMKYYSTVKRISDIQQNGAVWKNLNARNNMLNVSIYMKFIKSKTTETYSRYVAAWLVELRERNQLQRGMWILLGWRKYSMSWLWRGLHEHIHLPKIIYFKWVNFLKSKLYLNKAEQQNKNRKYRINFKTYPWNLSVDKISWKKNRIGHRLLELGLWDYIPILFLDISSINRQFFWIPVSSSKKWVVFRWFLTSLSDK